MQESVAARTPLRPENQAQSRNFTPQGSAHSPETPTVLTMTPVYVTTGKRSELLSLCMARDSWTHALAALRQLLAIGKNANQTNYDVLLTAACVLYMRPFEQSHGLVRLSQFEKFDELAEADFLRRTHEAVDKTRNQIMAHQQVSRWDKLLKGVPDVLPAHHLIVRLDEKQPMSYETNAPTLRPEFLGPFAHLVSIQQGRANHAFFQAVLPVLPNSGFGEFSIEVEAPPAGPTSVIPAGRVGEKPPPPATPPACKS